MVVAVLEFIMVWKSRGNNDSDSIRMLLQHVPPPKKP